MLVDSDPETWCIDIEKLRERVEKISCGNGRLRAIMPVHIYGHPADMDPIRELSMKYGLVIIEDAAEAHGAEYLSSHEGSNPTWQRCGGLGDLSIFSFYANKLITTGEGGMILTNDPAYAERARSLRNLCFQSTRRFYHTELGYNFRMTNIQAAIGLAQLERMEEIIARKRWIGKSYSERLRDIAGLKSPVEKPWAKHVYWMYGVVLDRGMQIDAVLFAGRLREQGIETRPFFLGLHEQPVLRGMGLFEDEVFPVAERLARYGLYLPSGLTLTESEIDRVAEAVRKILP